MITIVEGNNQLNVVMTRLADAGNPEILNLTIPTATPGGQFWPEAILKLPPADAYRMLFQVDPQIFYPQSGAVPIMEFVFASSIPDPTSQSGIILIPLDRTDNTYNLRGWRFNAKETYTYDQGLYNAMIAAEAAAQAAYAASQVAWANVTAVWEAIMASWPPGWEDDPNWQYTHPAYSYPEWRDAHDAAEAATAAYDAASAAHEAAQAAFYATEVRTYTRELWPARAFVFGLPSYNLPAGSYPVIGSIFKTIGGHETQFNFGEIGTLRVI